jgi:phage tail sheath protein FI
MSACSIVTEVIKSENKVILNVPLILNTPSQKVEKDTVVSSVEFDLSVHYQNLDENFKYLSLNPDHSRYIKKIIKDSASQLIKIDVLSTPPDTQPMPTLDKDPGWRLNGGLDGIDIPSSGIDAIVMGEDDDEPFNRTGIYTLRNINEISLVAIPGITTQAVQNSLITHCELMKNRFAVLDPIPIKDLKGIQEQRNLYDSKYAALYYPWIQVYDPLSQGPINAPPSGIICGIYARSDNERGVHKAPANEKINGALGLEKLDGTTRIITKGQQDILNPKGINCIRSFPGRGIRVWGARTISSDKLWKYVNVRRLFIYVEESIRENTQWVVFEPNNEKLWGRLKATITEFLTRVWMDGALMGTKPEEAFFVKCDRTTMSQSDIDNGRLICVIGIAPTKPAEFVIFRIAQWQGGSAVTE